ncbi:MAG TPA: FAD-dependent oxidoreductase [Polyangiaceae bacterium]
MRRIAVIGGGLAGLTVALRHARAGDRVSVFEAERRLGGQLFTERSAGFAVEHGAEGYVAGSAAVAKLASELGIADRVVDQLVFTSYGFDGKDLVPLAAGEAAQFLGFQVPSRELGKGIRSLAGGMGELVETLAAQVRETVDLRLASRVERVECRDTGTRLVLGSHMEGVDAVVVATTARVAAALLQDEFGASARALAGAAVNSSVTVSCAYRRSDVAHPLDGTGFVVAEHAQEDGLRACSFSSSKLPARAPHDAVLLRLFFRPADREVETLDDGAWIGRAERGLSRILGLRTRAERAWVSRWPDALPVFDAGHRERVAELESVLAKTGICLAGSAFHGAGIDAAVRSAFAAAESIGPPETGAGV